MKLLPGSLKRKLDELLDAKINSNQLPSGIKEGDLKNAAQAGLADMHETLQKNGTAGKAASWLLNAVTKKGSTP